MMSTAKDYARFCQMLLNDGVGPDGNRVLQTSSVRKLWVDSLAPFARGKAKRVRGWNDCGGPGGYKYWDYISWSAIGGHVTFPHRLRDVPRKGKGECMFMGG